MFILDSDPPIDGTNYTDDSKGDFNYHLKVIQGEDLVTINTVRGWCSWVLQKFTCLKGRKYIPKIIPLVYKLLNDNVIEYPVDVLKIDEGNNLGDKQSWIGCSSKGCIVIVDKRI